MEQQRHGGLRFSPTLSLFLFFSFLSFLFLSPPPSPGERASQQRTKHKHNPSRLATRAIHRRPRQEFCFHSASMHTHTHTRCVSIENCRSGHPSFFQLVSHLSPPPPPPPPPLSRPRPPHPSPPLPFLQAQAPCILYCRPETSTQQTYTHGRNIVGEGSQNRRLSTIVLISPARLDYLQHTHTHTHTSLSLSLCSSIHPRPSGPLGLISRIAPRGVLSMALFASAVRRGRGQR